MVVCLGTARLRGGIVTGGDGASAAAADEDGVVCEDEEKHRGGNANGSDEGVDEEVVAGRGGARARGREFGIVCNLEGQGS